MSLSRLSSPKVWSALRLTIFFPRWPEVRRFWDSKAMGSERWAILLDASSEEEKAE